MAELRLADGEEVVRRYDCTAVDRCAVIAGTVIPLRSRKARESKGTLTVTNRRVVYDMESVKGYSESNIHQETRIEDISSVSSMIGKFGRDIRVPVLMIVIGFILIFAPYVYALESGAMDTVGDYEDGYNAGVEYGYYEEYLDAIENGLIDNTIPPGYHVEMDQFMSPDFERGFMQGGYEGVLRAEADIAAEKDFSVPTDLMIHGYTSTIVLVLAVIGAVVFIMGSVLYAISSRTKDWFQMRFGAGGDSGVFITSMSCAYDRNGVSPTVPSADSRTAMEEIGAIITEIRAAGGSMSIGRCR